MKIALTMTRQQFDSMDGSALLGITDQLLALAGPGSQYPSWLIEQPTQDGPVVLAATIEIPTPA